MQRVMLQKSAALCGPTEEVSPGEMRWQLDVNLVGPMALARACLPALRVAGGGTGFITRSSVLPSG